MPFDGVELEEHGSSETEQVHGLQVQPCVLAALDCDDLPKEGIENCRGLSHCGRVLQGNVGCVADQGVPS